MKVGDLVRVKSSHQGSNPLYIWHEFMGNVGIVVGSAKRLHIPALKLVIKGEIAEFDLEEIERL